MIALLRTPARRIAFAVALSALIHALLLWLPHVSLPPPASQLPLLTAKLETVPMHTRKPLPRRRKTRHRRRVTHSKPAQPPPPVLAEKVAPPNTPAVPVAPPTPPAKVAAQSAAPNDDGNRQFKSSVPPLPRHAQLLFAAYLGTGDTYVGDMRHNLEIYEDGHYTLQAKLRTVGLARLFKRYNLTQTSRGTVTANGGLRPDEFSEERVDEQGKQDAASRFDWKRHQADFADGTKDPLPEHAQDILSFMYQLSQMSFDRATIPLTISNGRNLENYRLEVGPVEDVITPMGKLRALHLSKLHKPGEEGLDIWLGLAYRMLPVKFEQIDRTGKIAGELKIREIRLSDK